MCRGCLLHERDVRLLVVPRCDVVAHGRVSVLDVRNGVVCAEPLQRVRIGKLHLLSAWLIRHRAWRDERRQLHRVRVWLVGCGVGRNE